MTSMIEPDEIERARVVRQTVKLMHIFGQSRWHSPVEIVSNRLALIALRAAIDTALHEGSGRASVMTTDGEGYGVEIRLIEQDWEHPEWETLPMPYIAPEAAGKPDLHYEIQLHKIALKKANAALVKRGVKPIPEPETP